jgi:hypothetical protein
LGLEIDRDHFSEAEYARFARRLERSLEALAVLLARPGFGEGPVTLGAELEASLVDARARPLGANLAVLAETADPRLTVELDGFNLECNLRWAPVAGRPFSALEAEMRDGLDEMRRAAAVQDGRVAIVGILPTLVEGDLGPAAMTDRMRYRALSASLRRIREAPFRVKIHGEDDLEVSCEDVTLEGAATSLQVHLRVAPGRFRDVFNAIQLATAPVLAVSGNSPLFLGRRLWEETRVALFKQAVDARDAAGKRRREEPRVSFGRRWLEDGPLALFAEGVALHPPLLPVLDEEDPDRVLRGGGVPHLRELRLHQGTVWSWNRPIYDPADGGHLRIEMRALPAGPTTGDMVANVAFAVGLALGLAPEAPEWIRGVPFDVAHGNFYRAARSGLEAELLWPRAPGAEPEPVRAAELVARLLPWAQRGLDAAGVDPDESRAALAVVERRAATGRTGARWQRRVLAVLEAERPRPEALAALLERYLVLSEAGEPVHRWPLPEGA